MGSNYFFFVLLLSKDDIAGYSSEDNNGEENTGSARKLRSSSLRQGRHSYRSSDCFATPSTAYLSNCTSAVDPFASSPECGALFTQTPVLTYQSTMSLNHSTLESSSSSDLPVSLLETCPSTSQPSTSSATSLDPTMVLTCQNSPSSKAALQQVTVLHYPLTQDSINRQIMTTTSQ